MDNVFLKAEWRKLVVINYSIDAAILKPYIPYGTEIILSENSCFISIIGFMFLNTQVKGFSVPFHRNFEEINLRFYVKQKNSMHKGVVFIKEIVPKPVITFVANTLYNENYMTLPMRHDWKMIFDIFHTEYSLKLNNKWYSLGAATTQNTPGNMEPGSHEEFILENYWGFSHKDEKSSIAYEVEHEPWKTYSVKDYNIDLPFAALYGPEFDFLKDISPFSVIMAEGSEIKVGDKNIIR